MTVRRRAPDWLTARPIAHRGLHGAPTGFVENSLAAALAAADAGYAIECDVQLSGDGEAIVFHDFDLARLTGVQKPVAALTATELAATPYRDGPGAPPTLSAFLDAIGGRVPVIVEIKSAFDGDLRLATRATAVTLAYDGPVALKSFDAGIVAHLRSDDIGLPIGLVAQAETSKDAPPLPPPAFFETTLDFLSWNVGDLPDAVPAAFRERGLPVMTWTVRTPAQRETAARFADQIVFEGFRPPPVT